jgi:flagellar biosynthetic protein FliO
MADSLHTATGGLWSDFALWRSIGALILVLALMIAALYFLRRLQRGGGAGRAAKRLQLEVTGQLALAPKQFVSVVQVGQKQWVLGVTEHSIQYLGEYEGPLDAGPKASGEVRTNFAATLEKAVGRFGRSLSRSRTSVAESRA